MKFYEPKPGTPEAVNMSDDNSDGVSTDDCSTPPEYNNQNCDVNTSENNNTQLNEGIVLYLRRQNVASEVIQEDEDSEEETSAQVAPMPRCHSPPNSIFFQDLGLDEHTEGMENRFDNIRGTRFYNPASLFQAGRHPLIPIQSNYALPPLSLSPINTDENDSPDTESSNSDDRSSDYLNQMD